MNVQHLKEEETVQVRLNYLEMAILEDIIGDTGIDQGNRLHPNGQILLVQALYDELFPILEELNGETWMNSISMKLPAQVYIEKVLEDEASKQSS